MEDIPLYLILGIMGTILAYLVFKVRQPIIVKRERENPDEIPELGDIGDVLQELEPEIIKRLNLNEEQQETLKRTIDAIDTLSKSKLTKWIIKKVSAWA